MKPLSANRKAYQLIETLKQQGIHDSRVLRAISQTPRERFVAEALAHKAYQNTALPIGLGQTISQPYIVAKMTQCLLSLTHPLTKILEIGTGCGYQTAILAQLFPQVFTVERIKSLQYEAKRRLHALDLHNVTMKHGDGWQGWTSKGPYDAIVVTAAAAELPTELIAQLNDCGTIIIPIGVESQQLYQISKQQQQLTQQKLENVKFVPLVKGDTL